MSYLKLDTMQYPLYEGDIRIAYPHIKETQTGDSFPIPEGYVFVEEISQPTNIAADQYITVGTPVQVDGKWIQSWVVNTWTPEELESINKFKEEQAKLRKRPKPMPVDANGSAPNVID